MIEWISVKNYLPDDDREVLIYPRPEFYDTCFTGYYDTFSKKWVTNFYNGYNYESFNPNVPHWALINDPHKREENEQGIYV